MIALLDSKLVVDFVNNNSSPKQAVMQRLMQIAKRFANEGMDVRHVRSNLNARADYLSKMAAE